MQHPQIVSRGHTRPLTEICFFRDGSHRSLLISAAHDKLPQIRNGESGDWIGSFEGHKGAVWSAKLDSMTRTLAATASGDFTAKLWCATTGKELHEFKHKHVVRSVDFASDTLHIATGCQDGLIRVYDTIQPVADPVTYRVAEKSSEAPTKVIFGADDNMLLAGTRVGVLEIRDRRLPSDSAPVHSASLSSNKEAIMDIELSGAKDKLLVTVGGKVCLLSSGDLRVLSEFEMPSPLSFKDEGGASMHPEGRKFIAGGSDLWLREFDAQSGEVLRIFKGHHGPVRCVRYHPSGDVVASGSEDGTIRLWALNPAASSGELATEEEGSHEA